MSRARMMAEDENLTRLAYRTARLSRVSHKNFPKTEAALFETKPKRQSLADQFASAKLVTQIMSMGNH